MPSKSLPTDPLLALGPSLFLTILSFLPVQSILNADSVSKSWRATISTHSKGVWRSCSERSGVELKVMRMMRMLEDATSAQHGGPGVDGDNMWVIEPEPVTVDWRNICKTHVTLQNNWRHARCRARYLTPPNNTVWRIKVDQEQQTMLCTSRIRGLTVIDLKDSKPLFTIRGVRGWAHIEHARGFVVFDTDRINDEFSLEVWRSKDAIARSAHPPSETGSPLSSDVISFTNPSFNARTNDPLYPLPRGHLQYFCTITPPTPCLAFRVHVDRENEIGEETAVLATAGEEGVYIWDLDNAEKMERLEIAQEDRARVRYIELDDEFVFICGEELKIYSRESKNKLFSISSLPKIQHSHAGLLFSLRVHDDDSPFGPPTSTSDDVQRQVNSPVGEAEVENALLEDEDFEDKFASVPMEDSALLINVDHHFTACHFTTTDLICASTAGLYIIRDYRVTLKKAASLSENERQVALSEKSIFITFGDPVQQLTTYHDHIVLTTDKGHVVILEASALPSMPHMKPNSTALTTRNPPPRSRLIAHTLLGHSLASTVQSSCLQADRTSIYLTLWTLAPRRGVQEGIPNGGCPSWVT